MITMLAILAWKQTTYWSSRVRLWTWHTLAVTTNNDVAERGPRHRPSRDWQIDEAIAHDRAALRIRPHNANGLTNLANALVRRKQFPEAIEHYREVVHLRPNDSEAHRDLGKALLQNGASEEGMVQLREALRLRPRDGDAAFNLGNALLEKAISIRPSAFFESDRRKSQPLRRALQSRYRAAEKGPVGRGHHRIPPDLEARSSKSRRAKEPRHRSSEKLPGSGGGGRMAGSATSTTGQNR